MWTLSIHAFSAIRMVAAGHRMVTEGWTLFERTCEEVGPGELPQLLGQLKSAMTPTPVSPGPSRQSQWRKKRRLNSWQIWACLDLDSLRHP